MKIILNLIVLAIQGLTTLITLVVIYMLFALFDYQGGIDGFIGLTLFQPIMGGLLGIATIATCLLVGLPIRISKTINTWWTKNFWVSILFVPIGIGLIIISVLPSMSETIETNFEGTIMKTQVPHWGILITGWFLTAFSILHTFPPYGIRLWVEQTITKYTGWGK